MSTPTRLPGDAGYCDHCGRFVYLPTHDCVDTPPLATLMSQVRREAHEAGISLRQAGPQWVATDVETRESASGVTIVGAWAMLEDVEPTVIYRRLREANVSPLPNAERDLGDRFGDG